MSKKREIYLLIEQIRKSAGSELQYFGYKVDRRLLKEKIGAFAENEVFSIYWNRDTMREFEMDEALQRLKEIHLAIINKNLAAIKINEGEQPEI